MNEEQLFGQMIFWRQKTLKALDATTEEEADKMPEKFSNNLRWNFGHILVLTDSILLKAIGETITVQERYIHYFDGGTSPKDWKEAPPSLDELRRNLEAQALRLEAILKGRLDEGLAKPFLGLNTIGGLLLFAMNHECLHLGTINGLKKGL